MCMLLVSANYSHNFPFNQYVGIRIEIRRGRHHWNTIKQLLGNGEDILLSTKHWFCAEWPCAQPDIFSVFSAFGHDLATWFWPVRHKLTFARWVFWANFVLLINKDTLGWQKFLSSFPLCPSLFVYNFSTILGGGVLTLWSRGQKQHNECGRAEREKVGVRGHRWTLPSLRAHASVLLLHHMNTLMAPVTVNWIFCCNYTHC